MDDCIHNNPQKLCPNVANFWGLWSNVSNYIVELILVALAIYGGESFVRYEYFTIFVVLLGRVIPRAKGKFIFTKNLDNFYSRWTIHFGMSQCHSWRRAYRQECLLVWAPSRGFVR